ncbi:MAG: leucine-rich repeat domain-containing protein [Planctomycetaceae bacterium]|nr:leucine-rich repeat domain-containing protein [Planctomycetaceae bacterium]
MVRRAAIFFLVVSTLVGTAIGQQRKVSRNTTPQDCWSRLRAAQAKQDFAGTLACMTEAMQCAMVGSVAVQQELLAHHYGPVEKRVAAIRERHGIGHLAITEYLVVSQVDPLQGLVEAGAWVKDRAEFLKASAKLLEVDVPESLKPQLQVETQELPMLLTNTATPMAIGEVKIKEDVAEAYLKLAEPGSPDENRQQLWFRKLKGEWLLAVSAREPAVKAPNEQQRGLARLQTYGQLDRDYLLDADENSVSRSDEREQPNRFKYDRIDRGQRTLTDEPLGMLASIETLRAVEITDAPEVTDAGIKSLAGVKRLKRLTLNNLKITAASLESLIKLPDLRKLEMHNIDLDAISKHDLIE